MKSSSLLQRLPVCVVLAAVCAATAFGQTKAQPHEPLFQITGVVVSSVDGAPVPHSHLTPTLAVVGEQSRFSGRGRRFPAYNGGLPAATDSANADDRGRFVITLPSAGTWHLTAGARGFTTQAFQAHDQFSTAVVLTRDAPTINIRFVLSPAADITGVVLDEAGETVRRAQVLLMMISDAEPGQTEPAMTTRGATTTDDRGVYEFANLPPGDYRICVQAQPWYATAAEQGRRINSNNAADSPKLDPSLDVTYAPTWFPGVDDPASAETLTLGPGETRQADFHLLPVPSVHLVIAPAATSDGASGMTRNMPVIPLLQRVGEGAGAQPFVQVSFYRNAQGQTEVTGLSPGLYQIRLGGMGQDGRTSVVRLGAGAEQTLDLGANEEGEARVTVHVDGIPEEEARSVEVNLLDPDSGRSVLSPGMVGGFRMRGETRSGRGFNSADGGDRAENQDKIYRIPPGRYRVVLQGQQELYLRSISAKGAAADGRIVTVPAGDSILMLHVAQGRPTVTGVVSNGGKPLMGAAVMLVPATLGEQSSMTTVRRDQSNTDGSFEMRDVIPGQYILIAIDNGWQVNWNDAATLRRYLAQGVAVDLSAGGDVKQNVVAESP